MFQLIQPECWFQLNISIMLRLVSKFCYKQTRNFSFGETEIDDSFPRLPPCIIISSVDGCSDVGRVVCDHEKHLGLYNHV